MLFLCWIAFKFTSFAFLSSDVFVFPFSCWSPNIPPVLKITIVGESPQTTLSYWPNWPNQARMQSCPRPALRIRPCLNPFNSRQHMHFPGRLGTLKTYNWQMNITSPSLSYPVLAGNAKEESYTFWTQPLAFENCNVCCINFSSIPSWFFFPSGKNGREARGISKLDWHTLPTQNAAICEIQSGHTKLARSARIWLIGIRCVWGEGTLEKSLWSIPFLEVPGLLPTLMI